MANLNESKPVSRRPAKKWLALGGLLLVLLVWWWRSGDDVLAALTFAAKRGDLDITVLEGGSVQAAESQQIKCEVRVGYQGTKILKLIEEGYMITEDDIRTNKVLVELDSSEIQKQIAEQEIGFQSATASLTDAQQNFQIQLAQNQSDIKAAEQKARFAMMDFEKFLGSEAAAVVLKGFSFDFAMALKSARDELAQVATGALLSTNNTALTGQRVTDLLAHNDVVDFSPYAKIEVLGDGETKQKLRKLDDDYQVAMKEMNQAKTTLDGTKRLFDKGFATRTDLQRDEIASENNRLKVQTAETARTLYLKYEFQKSAEESLSKVLETFREMDRSRKSSIAKMAQAEAKLKSAQGQYNVQVRRRKELQDQSEKCLIKATKPGLVVYGRAGMDMMYYGGEEPIREGASVREQQVIITIPDLTKMQLKVKIHESYIKKVKKEQKVAIKVDAFPDQKLTGLVTQVAVLPDSQNRWMNPDMKVYLTTIEVEGTHDWLKPGMSAKADIFVNTLTNVIYVPMQAVVPEEDKQVCYVLKGTEKIRREIKAGDFNDEFIEIKEGIEPGELVVLKPTSATEKESNDGKAEEKTKPENSAKSPAAGKTM
ncbi:MAG: macA 1 [Verrucomicrobia bacterium]|jgi:multidrug efflux pump subunit AcrA (membrane-fusion protein)|nr:macA 1 [Verrucomicrobiota bacterium]